MTQSVRTIENCFRFKMLIVWFPSSGDADEETAACINPAVTVKKVNSQVNIDEKTGQLLTSTDCDLEMNFDVNDKIMNQKFMQLQPSCSLPDLQSGTGSTPSSAETISSNSNNQTQSHGKHVILAVDAEDNFNQIDDAAEHAAGKKKMNFNIDPKPNGSTSSSASSNDPKSNGSSSSVSSNNLEEGQPSPSTL